MIFVSISTTPSSPVYSTTHAARVVILAGCALALAGVALPWTGSNALVLDLTKAGVNQAAVLVPSLAASTLALVSFVLLVRLSWPAPVFILLIGFLQLIVLGSIRSQLDDPAIGLYLLPAGCALVEVGGLMALAYPAKRLSA